MKDDDILLTIAIPTYNRPFHLKRCLESVIPQLTPETDILISDNSTNDEISKLILESEYKSEHITYIKNAENIGPDANFLQCLRKSRGRFVHILGDDDLLLDGAIREIKRLLTGINEYDIIFLNHKSWGGIFKVNSRKDFSLSVDEFILTVSYALTYNSAIIFNRKRFLEIKNPERYIGSMLLQTNLVIEMLRDDGKTTITAMACVSSQPIQGQFGGYDIYRVFAENWKNTLLMALHQGYISKRTFRRVFSKTIFPFLTKITFLYRNEDNLRPYVRNRRLLFANTKGYLTSWVFLYPICLVPLPLLHRFKNFAIAMSNFVK